MKPNRYIGIILALTLVKSALSQVISPEELTNRIDSGERILLIDIRSANDFQDGHIPGAINIPFDLIAAKALPPLGDVVVYDNGLGLFSAAESAGIMNSKPGINAAILQGGFAAWQSHGGLTTRKKGLTQEDIPRITYHQLIETSDSDIVLVDLRPSGEHDSPSREADASPDPVATLAETLPGARVVSNPFPEISSASVSSSSAARSSATARSDEAALNGKPLLVLIDTNDGTAEETGRGLKANGYHRFVILTGGIEIIERQGRSGLKRDGRGIHRSHRGFE